MTRDEVVREMAKAACCPNGCIAEEQNDAYQSNKYECTSQWDIHKLQAALARAEECGWGLRQKPDGEAYGVVWQTIAKDDRLADARRRLSIHEFRIVIEIIAQAMYDAGGKP